MKQKQAFTLVELLVVVAVIVILISLLMPALDRAMYQTELAVCGTNLRSIANAAVTYATGNKRSYPYRTQAQFGQHLCRLGYNNGNNDDRPLLEQYMPVNKIMQDPLSGKVDLNTKVANSEVYGAYNLWFWVRFQSAGMKGMYKLGNRFTWVNSDSGTAKEYAFNFLASDRSRWQGANHMMGSHPDAEGIMRLTQLQDAQSPITSGNTRIFTLSQWESPNRGDSGPFDMNYAYDDGSVLRFNQIYWNEWADPSGRTTRVPSLTNPSAFPGYADHVPKP